MSTLVGLVTIARHGDRTSFYQNPNSYAGSNTYLTPLGEQEEYQLGQYLRSQYLTPGQGSPLTPLATTSDFNSSYFHAYADAGDEGGVIYDSAVAMLQGLFAPTAAENITLANGTNVVSPLGGYQYVPITSVPVAGDFSSVGFALEGFSNCPAFTAATNMTYASSGFQQMAQQVAPALASLQNLLPGANFTLQNAYNEFDEINVRSIYNATFLNETTPNQLATARWLGNYHENVLFSSSSNASAIQNIAFNAMAPGVLAALNTASNSSNLVRWQHFQISYKPFISFFSLANVTELSGIVNYASYMALELRQNTDGSQVVRMLFRNGTEGDASIYPMFGNAGDTPLSQFQETIGSSAISTLSQWCTACNQTSYGGCNLINQLNTTTAQLAALSMGSSTGNGLTLAQAGGIGAGVTLGVVFILMGLLAGLGLVSFGKKHHSGDSLDSGSDRHEK